MPSSHQGVIITARHQGVIVTARPPGVIVIGSAVIGSAIIGSAIIGSAIIKAIVIQKSRVALLEVPKMAFLAASQAALLGASEIPGMSQAASLEASEMEDDAILFIVIVIQDQKSEHFNFEYATAGISSSSYFAFLHSSVVCCVECCTSNGIYLVQIVERHRWKK